MPGWEKSRHPEWDLMYAAGLTVREISDREGHPRSTVHRHLQRRELYSPGLRATHERARDARQPDWPSHHWRLRLDDLMDFVTNHDREPSTQGTADEQSLHQWLIIQRLEYRHGMLHPAKVEALNLAWPDWVEKQ